MGRASPMQARLRMGQYFYILFELILPTCQSEAIPDPKGKGFYRNIHMLPDKIQITEPTPAFPFAAHFLAKSYENI
jgi:hypothetical protein